MQEVVDELDVGIAAVAAELGDEFGFLAEDHSGAEGVAPFPNLPYTADVFGRDGLVFVDQEDGEEGGIDDFLDLVLAAPVAVHLFHEAMGFVDDQAIVPVGSDV